MNFPSQIFFNDINDINHGYTAAGLKKSFLWLLPFYVAVATYFYYERLRRTMRTAIVSYLLKINVLCRTSKQNKKTNSKHLDGKNLLINNHLAFHPSDSLFTNFLKNPSLGVQEIPKKNEEDRVV